MKDDLTNKLVEKYQLFQSDKDPTNSLNNLRDYLLMSVLLDQFYPLLEKQARMHLKKAAERSVIRHC